MHVLCLYPHIRFFLFLTLFFKLFLKLTLFIFFKKTNTFGRACLHGAANSLCRAMHGGAAGGSQRLRRPLTWQSYSYSPCTSAAVPAHKACMALWAGYGSAS